MTELAPVDFLKNVASKINRSTPEVVQSVEDALVKVEVERVAATLLKAISNLKKLFSDGSKIRPDVKTFDLEGKVSESFSQAKFEEKRKHEEKVKKLEEAIASFMNSNEETFKQSLNKLEEMIQKTNQEGNK